MMQSDNGTTIVMPSERYALGVRSHVCVIGASDGDVQAGTRTGPSQRSWVAPRHAGPGCCEGQGAVVDDPVGRQPGQDLQGVAEPPIRRVCNRSDRRTVPGIVRFDGAWGRFRMTAAAGEG